MFFEKRSHTMRTLLAVLAIVGWSTLAQAQTILVDVSNSTYGEEVLAIQRVLTALGDRELRVIPWNDRAIRCR